jgi:DNA-binding MarR family transcriptional regulator
MSETLFQTALRELESIKEDIRPSDIVVFSEPLRIALNFAIRAGRFSLTEFAEKLGFTRAETKRLADILVKRNLFEIKRSSPTEEIYYQARLTAMTRPLNRPPSDIWDKIK